jgi:hypothetical protein
MTGSPRAMKTQAQENQTNYILYGGNEYWKEDLQLH